MLLDDVRVYLVSHGVTSGGWVLYEAFMPDDQNKTIALFETGGYPATELNRETENVTFQVCVRSGRLDYPTARSKWQQVFDLLEDAQQTAGSPVLLPGVVFIQPMHYGPMVFNDPSGRPNLTSNWRVKRYKT